MVKDYQQARLWARFRGGKIHEAESLEREFDLDDQYKDIETAARNAGRSREFADTLAYMERQRRGMHLEAFVPREEVFARLMPFAMSDEAFVRKQFPDLKDNEVRDVVRAARSESAASRRAEADKLFNDARVRLAQTEENTGRKRIRVDTTGPAKKVDPFVTDARGRAAKLDAYQSDTLIGRTRARAARAAQRAGFNVRTTATKTNEDAVLDSLRERYGVEIITPERAQRMRARKGSVTRRAVKYGVRSVWSTLTVGPVGAYRAVQQRRLLRRIESTDDAEEARRLRQKYDQVRAKDPWRLLGVRTFREFLKAVPRSTLLLTVLGLVAMVFTLGAATLFAATQQALLTGVATGFNFLILAANAILAFIFGSLYVVGNFVLNIVNGALGLLYDGVWTSIGRHVPGAEYLKPVITFTSTAVPQIAYIMSLLHVDVDENGVKTYDHEFVAVTAQGEPTGGLFWSANGLSAPQFQCQVVDEAGTLSPCRTIVEAVRDGFRERICQVFDNTDMCQTPEATS